MVYLNLYVIDWKSWRSILIALVTKSIYTHAAIQVGEQLFEASGDRPSAGWVHESHYHGRECKKIPLDVTPDLAAAMLNKYLGKKYDYTALRLWFFSVQNKNKYYCFELCYEFLDSLGLTSGSKAQGKFTAHTLIKNFA